MSYILNLYMMSQALSLPPSTGNPPSQTSTSISAPITQTLNPLMDRAEDRCTVSVMQQFFIKNVDTLIEIS